MTTINGHQPHKSNSRSQSGHDQGSKTDQSRDDLTKSANQFKSLLNARPQNKDRLSRNSFADGKADKAKLENFAKTKNAKDSKVKNRDPGDQEDCNDPSHHDREDLKVTPILTPFNTAIAHPSAPHQLGMIGKASQDQTIAKIEQMAQALTAQIHSEKARGLQGHKVEITIKNNMMPDTKVFLSRGIDGTIQVHFETASQAASQMIQKNYQTLENRLKKQNDQIKISLKAQNGGYHVLSSGSSSEDFKQEA